MGLKEYDDAILTLKHGIQLDKDAKEFRTKLAEAQKLMNSKKNKEKDAYSKMFENF